MDTRDKAVTQLMKDNFDRYVACQDAILGCYALLQERDVKDKGDITGRMAAKQKGREGAVFGSRLLWPAARCTVYLMCTQRRLTVRASSGPQPVAARVISRAKTARI